MFQNYPLGQALPPLADFTISNVTAVERPHYPLTCFVSPGELLDVKIVYDTTRFAREGIERLLEHGRRTFLATAEDAMKPLDAARTFPPQELDMIVSATGGPVRRHGWPPVHERIGRIAALHPDRVAVVCGTNALSYRELAERSNTLARTLNRTASAPRIAWEFTLSARWIWSSPCWGCWDRAQ